MRWRRVEKREPKVGATRIVRRFIWWPLELKGETRWLETAEIRQRAYKRTLICDGIPPGLWPQVMDWADDHWVPE